MKNFIFNTFLILVTAVAVTGFAQTYWPHDTAKHPIQRGTHLGWGYVIATNDASALGSIAIGGYTTNSVAMTLDATNACQIGTGANLVDSSIQYLDQPLAQVFIDIQAVDTDTTVHWAPHAGCILVGKASSSDKAWISSDAGTNNWVLLN